MTVLLLTNGDSAADLLKAAQDRGRVEPWRDSLLEGPLPPLGPADDYQPFREIRSGYWAGRGAGDAAALAAEYKKRDELLAAHQDYEQIELWFEHDLYDQLQLIEILTRLYHAKRFEGVSLVQAGDYLGMMSPEQLKGLEDQARPVTEQMMAIAELAIKVVTDETPLKLAEFVSLKPAGFPFLAQALHRLLEELPGPDGLSRTERQMLYSINRGMTKPGMLFARCQAMEAAQFWGDWGFFHVLSGLQYCAQPLISGLPEPVEIAIFQDGERRKAMLQASLSLTAEGQDVLEGRADHASLNEINRHVGGVHLTPQTLWRYDVNLAEISGPR